MKFTGFTVGIVAAEVDQTADTKPDGLLSERILEMIRHAINDNELVDVRLLSEQDLGEVIISSDGLFIHVHYDTPPHVSDFINIPPVELPPAPINDDPIPF